MRGWWLLGFLVVGAAGLAIGSRWLPEIEEQFASLARGAHKATTAGHAGDIHDHEAEKAADVHDDGDEKDEHEGEAAGAHAGEGDAHEKGKAERPRRPQMTRNTHWATIPMPVHDVNE